jgi:formylglycine-generating enzyme required for sulfatase activity
MVNRTIWNYGNRAIAGLPAGGGTTINAGLGSLHVSAWIAWGLCDTVGNSNAWEWVRDWHNEEVYADPAPPKSGMVHVLKGASFSRDQTGAHYFIHAVGPGDKFDVGLRIVKDVP